MIKVFLLIVCAFVLALPAFAQNVGSAVSRDLYSATKRGDLAGIRKAIRNGANVNQEYVDGETALIRAATEGQTLAAEYLIACGAERDACDNLGITPLGYSAGNGHYETAVKLLELHCMVDGRRLGVPPILLAAECSDVKIIKLLLSHHAHVDAKDPRGNTALGRAAWASNPSVVRLLLEAGANPAHRNLRGKTPMNLATLSKKKAVVKMLSEWMAKSKTKT